MLNHGQLSAESLLPHQGGSCHSGDLNLDEVGGLGGKGCVVPWPVLGDAATESVSLLASPSLLQQTFMKALSLFQIPQNVVCILHAPYPSPWGGGRNVYHGAPLRALSGSSHSAINVNSVHSSIHLIFYAYKSWLQVSVSVFQDNFTVCRLLSCNFSPFSTVKIPFYYLLASDEK